MFSTPHIEIPQTRREFLEKSGFGFGSVALASLLAQDEAFSAPHKFSTTAGELPHHRPRAKNIIFLFMEGGPSHIDLFDPKPLLNKLAGQSLPDSFGEILTAAGESRSPLLVSKRKWKQYGEAGTWVSDWLPEIATCVDDICRNTFLLGRWPQPLIECLSDEYMFAARRSPFIGKLGVVRPRIGKQESPLVCGDAG